MIRFATDYEVAQMAVVAGIKIAKDEENKTEIKVSFQDLVSLVRLTQAQGVQQIVRGMK